MFVRPRLDHRVASRIRSERDRCGSDLMAMLGGGTDIPMLLAVAAANNAAQPRAGVQQRAAQVLYQPQAVANPGQAAS